MPAASDSDTAMPKSSVEHSAYVALIAVLVVLGFTWQRKRHCRRCTLTDECGATSSEYFLSGSASACRRAQVSLPITAPHFSELFCGFICPTILFRYLPWHELAQLRRADQLCARLFALSDVIRQLACMGLDHTKRITRGVHALLENGSGVSGVEVRDAVVADALRSKGDLAAALVARNAHGQTCVLLAVQRRHLEALVTLLQMGAQPDYGDTKSGWSPLMFAVSGRDQDAAKLLVAHGASVNYIARPHGYTPLMAALGMSDEGFVTWLLDSGADPSYTLSTLKANLSHYGKEYDLLRRTMMARSNKT